MKCLALDIASKTGWATTVNGALCFGMYEVKSAGEGEGLGFYGFEIWLATMIRENRPDLIAVEAAVPTMPNKQKKGFTNFQTQKVLLGLQAIAKLVGVKTGIEVCEVYASTARKTVTGSGAIKKPEVIKFLRERGYAVKEDNAADSLVIYLHTLMIHQRAGDDHGQPHLGSTEGALRA